MNRGLYQALLSLYRFADAKLFWRLPLPLQRWIYETAIDIKQNIFMDSQDGWGINIQFIPSPSLPAWVIDEMKAIGQTIDPQLYASKKTVSRTRRWSVPVQPRLGVAYAKMTASLKGQYTHCFIVPWLKRGGADLGALHHIQAVAEKSGTKVLLILTEHTDSAWLSRIPQGVETLTFGDAASGMSFAESTTILVRILVQLAPPVIHIINSRLAWKAVLHHGLAIRQKSHIFASLFCDDYTHDGIPKGFGCDYLPRCYQHLTKVLCDSNGFPQSLIKQYGYSQSLFQTVYFPATFPDALPQRPATATRQILWAGRLDRQKRVDILAKIAAALPDCQFLVFGKQLLDTDGAALQALRRLSNVKMMGAYDGFSSLPTQSCDLFLYTSQWDGIPNVILEAIMHGLPVVASNVGGISELIHEETGYLIDPYDSVDDFVSAIRHALMNKDEACARAQKALELVKQRHTVELFKESLDQLPAYFPASLPSERA